jgi:ADP-L-glycero-D-manno-heptose 6-epimerase
MSNQRPVPEGTTIVTGAAGLVGSAVIWELNQRGYDDIIAVEMIAGAKDDTRWQNLAPLRIRDYIEAGPFRSCMRSIVDKEHVPRLEGVTTIIHLGAVSSPAITDVERHYVRNYEFSRQLLGTFADDPKIRIVYASTAATYGNQGDFSDALGKLADLRPENVYAFFKHQLDIHALKRGWLDRVAGVKLFNVYGPNEHHKYGMQSLVFRGPRELKSPDNLFWFGRGTIKLYRPQDLARDFIYVKDAADAILHLALGGGTGMFNVGTGVAMSWLEIAREVCQLMNRDPESSIRWQNLPPELTARGYQAQTRADITRILETGWKPRMPGLNGVDDCLARYVLKGKRLGE